jgi:hypothetical protein
MEADGDEDVAHGLWLGDESDHAERAAAGTAQDVDLIDAFEVRARVRACHPPNFRQLQLGTGSEALRVGGSEVPIDPIERPGRPTRPPVVDPGPPAAPSTGDLTLDGVMRYYGGLRAGARAGLSEPRLVVRRRRAVRWEAAEVAEAAACPGPWLRPRGAARACNAKRGQRERKRASPRDPRAPARVAVRQTCVLPVRVTAQTRNRAAVTFNRGERDDEGSDVGREPARPWC